ncbi:MAG: ABC transporter ATP-binding protein [Blastocatellia bacterium]
MKKPSPDFAIETFGLTKSYRGGPGGDQVPWIMAAAAAVVSRVRRPQSHTVVDNVSLSVRPGEMFGVLGSNGAGKTTLLKMLSCLLLPDKGDGQVNGYNLRKDRMAIRKSVAISKAQGGLGLLWQLNGRDNLLFRARLSGRPGKDARIAVDGVLDRLDLARKARSYSWELSSGEVQKFNLAATFISQAPIVLLDEPTSHLDPRTANDVRKFIKQDMNGLNEQTVLMSTHYLEEADVLCDRVAIILNGKVVACDTPASLKTKCAEQEIVEIRAANYSSEIGDQVKQGCGLSELIERFEDLTAGQVRLRPKWENGPRDTDGLCARLTANGVRVTSCRRVTPTLDDVYYQLTKEKVK